MADPTPPPPLDWQGLLKWSLQFTDGTQAAQPRSPEDIEFFSKAIKEFLASQPDPYRMVQDSVPKLDSKDANEVLAALGVIDECLENVPEIARDLQKLGAVGGLMRCIKREKESLIVEKTLDILAGVLPHNPSIQRAFFKEGALDELCKPLRLSIESFCKRTKAKDSQKVQTEPVNENDYSRLRLKYLTCASALIRHENEIAKEFISKGGLSIAVWCLKSSDVKCACKSISLINQLMVDNQITPAEFQNRNLIDASRSLLNSAPITADYCQLGDMSCSFAEQINYYIESHPAAKFKDLEHFYADVEKRHMAVEKLLCESVNELSKSRGTELQRTESVLNEFCGLKSEKEALEKIKKLPK